MFLNNFLHLHYVTRSRTVNLVCDGREDGSIQGVGGRYARPAHLIFARHGDGTTLAKLISLAYHLLAELTVFVV